MKNRMILMAILLLAAAEPATKAQTKADEKVANVAAAAIECPSTAAAIINDSHAQDAARPVAMQIVTQVRANPNKVDIAAFLTELSTTLVSRLRCTVDAASLQKATSAAAALTATAVAKTSQTNNQVSATSTASGTTSVVEKTGITQLLGIAAQDGAINNNVTGNTMTLSTSAYGILTGFGLIDDTSATYQNLALFPRLGASATFNLTTPGSTSNTASIDSLASATRREVSQWQVKFTIKDTTTRSSKVVKLYNDPSRGALLADQAVVNDLSSRPMVQITFPLQQEMAKDASSAKPSDMWLAVVTEAKKDPDCSQSAVPDPCSSLENAILTWASQWVIEAANTLKPTLQTALVNYAKDEAAAIVADQGFRTQVANLQKGWNGAFTFGEQYPATSATTTTSGVTMPSAPVYLIAGGTASWQKTKGSSPGAGAANTTDSLKGFQSWTTNFNGSFYPNPLASLNEQNFRGVTASTELDWNLGRSAFLGDVNDRSEITLGLSGQYQRLEENKDKSGRRPDLVLGNLKLEIPIAAGVSFPLSFTVANASELVKETYIKGNFGITFDLSKLAPLLSAKK